MIIKLAKIEESEQIAKIHYQEINHGFLSQLGIKFLTKLYQAIISHPDSFILVAKEGPRVIGYISGSTQVSAFYRYFLKKYSLQVLPYLIPKLFKLSACHKIIETLNYCQQGKKEKLPPAELLSLAILKKYQGQGIAPKLLQKFVLEMGKKRVPKFKVIVGKRLRQAINFYEKSGFTRYSSISIHKNEPSNIYLYFPKLELC